MVLACQINLWYLERYPTNDDNRREMLVKTVSNQSSWDRSFNWWKNNELMAIKTCYSNCYNHFPLNHW
jgi:hypothetical protein